MMGDTFDDGDALDVAQLTGVTVSTSERRMTGQVRARGQTGANDAAEPGEDCEIQQPLGLMARPIVTARTEAVYLRRGDELVITCMLDTGRSAQSVESGETRLYGAGADNQTAVVRIRANGSIEVTPAAGQSLTFAEGAQPYVRGTDFADANGVFLDALVTFLTGLNTVMVAVGAFATATGTALAVPFPAVGAAATTLNTAIGVFSGAITTMTSAANTMKAQRSTYLSTRINGL